MRFRFLDRFRISSRTSRKWQAWMASVWNVITYPVRLIFGLFRWIGQLIAEWWEQRNLRFLLQGLPAFILFCGAIVFAATVFFQDRNALATEYQWRGAMSLETARQARIEQKDFQPAAAMAKTCYKRLSKLQPNKDENSFFMALVYELQGQYAAVRNIMLSLAPLDKRGFGPAHFIVGQELCDRRRNPTPAMLDQAEVHFLRAIAYNREPYASDAHGELARICFMRNRPEVGFTHLVASVERAADPKPVNRMDLARLYRQQGKKDLAQRQLQAASESLRKKLDDHVEDPVTRLLLINCLNMMGEFEEAREVCLQGIAVSGAKEQTQRFQQAFRAELYRVYLLWYDSRSEDPKFTAEQRVALLESALQLQPQDPEVLQRLLTFTRKTGGSSAKAQEMLRQLIDGGKESAVVHLILGIDAWQNNSQADARHHWEKALKLYKDNPQAARGIGMVSNNLAWALAHFPPVDLDRALALIDAAIAQDNDPRYRGTRGHILAKMGRHKEAVADLEIAKAAHPNDPRLFEQLSESCEKIGLKLESEHYKKVAEEIRKKAAAAAEKASGPPSGQPAPPATENKPPSTNPSPDGGTPAKPAAPKPQ